MPGISLYDHANTSLNSCRKLMSCSLLSSVKWDLILINLEGQSSLIGIKRRSFVGVLYFSSLEIYRSNGASINFEVSRWLSTVRTSWRVMKSTSMEVTSFKIGSKLNFTTFFRVFHFHLIAACQVILRVRAWWFSPTRVSWRVMEFTSIEVTSFRISSKLNSQLSF